VASKYGRRPEALVTADLRTRRIRGAVEGRGHGHEAGDHEELRKHMAKDYKDLVVGLDIGTAKVMVVVAEVMPGGELKLAGLGVRRPTASSAAWW
jgi:hypothetical protein